MVLLALLLIAGNTFYQPDCILGDMDNIHSSNGNVEPGDKNISIATSEGEVQHMNSGSRRLSPPSVAIETPKETPTKTETTKNVSPSPQPSPSPAPDRPEDQNNNNQKASSPAHNSEGHASPSPSPPAPPSLPKVDIDYSLPESTPLNPTISLSSVDWLLMEIALKILSDIRQIIITYNMGYTHSNYGSCLIK